MNKETLDVGVVRMNKRYRLHDDGTLEPCLKAVEIHLTDTQLAATVIEEVFLDGARVVLNGQNLMLLVPESFEDDDVFDDAESVSVTDSETVKSGVAL